jgi:nitric oxide reductase subunit B
MNATQRLLTGFSLLMLLAALGLGVLASFAFLYPDRFNSLLPFHQLRPMHVSAALFWIISAAGSGILVYRPDVFKTASAARPAEKAFVYLWIATISLIFGFYTFRKFGGREYWEFPPLLCLPILAAWLCLMLAYFRSWRARPRNPPLYVWMWTTGIIAFLFTFLEQNLYQIPWFRASYLREVTVQWKSNGAMVGAWNQMIYGTSLYIMTRISGDEGPARSKIAFFFYFLGLTNLMFNWGHHIYNLPVGSWIRHISYAISMTEWIILISIMHDFRRKLTAGRKFRHLLSYRFLIASEYWVALNLALALFMSVPAINRYTHGTHITVAHAMGATIGINTMILLSSMGYMLRVDDLPERNKKLIQIGFALTQLSLLLFWLSLVLAGILKGYRDVALGMNSFQEMMQPVHRALHVFAFAGICLAAGLGAIAIQYLVALRRRRLPRIVEEHSLVRLGRAVDIPEKTGSDAPVGPHRGP